MGVATAAVVASAVLAGWLTVNAVDDDVPTAPAAQTETGPSPPPAPPAPTVTPAPADVPLAPLAAPDPRPLDPQAGQQAQQAARQRVSGAELGVEVFDRTTGAVVAGADTDQKFPCMSVVKLFIAVDVLDRAPGGVPDPDTADRLRRMLSTSDDAVASAFWSSEGGPELINRTVDRLGLTTTSPPPRNPSEWGDVLTSPQDMVTLYRHITDQMPQPSRDLVVDALAHTSRTASDGFDQFFGIPSGLDGLPWAVKQGWGTSGGEAAMASTGLVGPDSRYVVVLLGKGSAGSYRSLTSGVTAAAESLAGPLGAPQ